MTDYDLNGWTFKIEEDTGRPVSWVYRDVRNRGHGCAREISIEKIVVKTVAGGKPEQHSLEYAQFEAQSWEETFELLPVQTLEGAYALYLANFSVYQGKGPILKLKTKPGVLPPNHVHGKEVDEPLYLFVAFSFSAYGNDPPHEFTGALAAARFTPAVRFETRNTSVQSIRVHFRFHFDLDSYLQSAWPLTKWVAEMKDAIFGRENYALVIRDADHFPPSVLGVIRLFKEVSALFADASFFGARLEECGYGGTCRNETSSLELELAHTGTNRLLVTFRPPGPTFSDASKALAKTSVPVGDKKVSTVLAATPATYDPAQVDLLAAEIHKAVAGTKPAQGIGDYAGFVAVTPKGSPMPGVSAECLARYVKYSLVQFVARRHLVRRGAAIVKRLELLQKTIRSDLEDVLKHLELPDLEQMLAGLAKRIRDLPVNPLPPVLFPLGDLQKLVGKVMSIVGFDGAEKPVLYELVGRYVVKGQVTDTWDNMHWWGTEEIPSAPGAFHAVHSHFRWTQLNTYPTPEETQVLEGVNALLGGAPLHLGTPQLRSMVKKFAENQLSGPLIDPTIPDQTILFAIARSGGELDKALKESKEPFDTITVKPKLIAEVSELGNSGADIVYWVSCEARRAGEEVFRGTLLVNGFYFAHDEERPLSLFRPPSMFAPTEGVDLQKPQRTKPYDLVRGPFSA